MTERLMHLEQFLSEGEVLESECSPEPWGAEKGDYHHSPNGPAVDCYIVDCPCPTEGLRIVLVTPMDEEIDRADATFIVDARARLPLYRKAIQKVLGLPLGSCVADHGYCRGYIDALKDVRKTVHEELWEALEKDES